MKKHLKALAVFLAGIMLLCMTASAYAGGNDVKVSNASEISGSVYDGADLLSDKEEALLSDKLDAISDKYNCGVSVITLNSTGSYSTREYAKAIFNQCGYGRGSGNNGIMLAVCMQDRSYELITHGYGTVVLTDYGCDYIIDKFLPALSDGDYAKAFSTYADYINDFFKQAADSAPYDVDNPARLSFSEKIIPWAVSFAIALVIALIICGILALSMKHGSSKISAENYVEKGSFNLTDARDYFLYKTVHKVKKESSGKSSGSGGSHTDSDGFGGKGGHF